jgi:hypothetical protein
MAGAERFAAVVKALTGREPRIIERSNGKIEVECGRGHLDGFARYAELAEAIEKWLEETSRLTRCGSTPPLRQTDPPSNNPVATIIF